MGPGNRQSEEIVWENLAWAFLPEPVCAGAVASACTVFATVDISSLNTSTFPTKT